MLDLDEISTFHDVEEIVKINSTSISVAMSISKLDHLTNLFVGDCVRLWSKLLRLCTWLVVVLLFFQFLLFLLLLSILDFFFVESISDVP